MMAAERKAEGEAEGFKTTVPSVECGKLFQIKVSSKSGGFAVRCESSLSLTHFTAQPPKK